MLRLRSLISPSIFITSVHEGNLGATFLQQRLPLRVPKADAPDVGPSNGTPALPWLRDGEKGSFTRETRFAD